MTQDPKLTGVYLSLDPGEDFDAELLDRLTRQLRDEHTRYPHSIYR